jgi:hypothetical protein
METLVAILASFAFGFASSSAVEFVGKWYHKEKSESSISDALKLSRHS